MAKADLIYKQLVEEIHKNGVWDKGQEVRTKYADGTPAYTKSIIGKQVIFESDELALITTKHVAVLSAISEGWWIWFLQSNVVQELRDLGSKVWNEWEKPDGTIGRAYGHQLGKPVRKVRKAHLKHSDYRRTQFEYLIDQLKNNKASRRLVTSLWNINDLDDMALEPCVWSQQWLVQNGELHLIVNQRSADIALGVVFNWFQYRVIHKVIAKLTNLKVGRMIWNFGSLHYYDRHEELLLKQIEGETHNQAKLIIPSKEELEYYIFEEKATKEDLRRMFRVEDYKHNGKFEYEVAL